VRDNIPNRQRDGAVGGKRPLVWFFILAKRLIFRRSFAALLLLIPALGALMSIAAREESGITTVLLVAEGGDHEISHSIVKDILDEKSIINFKEYDSADYAIETVSLGKADAAWVFPEGLSDVFAEYAKDISKDVTLAHVYQSEENPVQRLVREKLNGSLFPYLSKAMYEPFMASAEGVGVDVDPEEFTRYCEEAAFKESIVEYDYLGAVAPTTTDTNYLTSPVRGIAALAAFLCTVASSLYSMQDETGGFYSRIPLGERLPLFFASNFAAALISSLMMLASFALCGIFTSVLPELAAAAAFAVSSASFATLLCRVFSTPFALGAAIPPMTIASAVLSPVFISVRFSVRADLLFPVTYALRALRAPRYVLFALIYSVVTLALAAALDLVRRKRLT
jgi:hypothetical protein